MSELTIRLRSDFPNRDEIIKVSSSDTVRQVKQLALKTLDLDSFHFDQYSVSAAAFLQSVIDLDDESKTLADCGVKNYATIFFKSPSAAAQQKRKPIEEEEDKTTKKTSSKSRFAGLTPQNCWKKLQDAPPTQRKVVSEYMDMYAEDIIDDPAFLEISKDALVSFLKADNLNVWEPDLFRAVEKWGKAEAVRNKLEPVPEVLAKLLSDVVIHVRILTMGAQDIATVVAASKLLPANQLLQIFSFLGKPELKTDKPIAKSILPEAISMFNARPRSPRPYPPKFNFSPTLKHNQLALANDVLLSNTTSYYMTALADVELTNGVHEWEIHLTNINSNTFACCVGVAPAGTDVLNSSIMVGYPGHVNGWSYCVTNAQAFHNNQVTYGRVLASGTVVGVRLNLTERTLEYFIDGVSAGVAFTDVTGPVRPSVSLYGNNSVKLVFSRKLDRPRQK